MQYKFISPQKITEMLFDDPAYVAEFCEAGIVSFNEFIESFQSTVMDRNMEELRKAGHKIKPGAQMMGADEVIEEYEHAKTLLEEDASAEELSKSVEKMQNICSTIKKELTNLAENPD